MGRLGRTRTFPENKAIQATPGDLEALSQAPGSRVDDEACEV